MRYTSYVYDTSCICHSILCIISMICTYIYFLFIICMICKYIYFTHYIRYIISDIILESFVNLYYILEKDYWRYPRISLFTADERPLHFSSEVCLVNRELVVPLFFPTVRSILSTILVSMGTLLHILHKPLVTDPPNQIFLLLNFLSLLIPTS